VFPVIPPFPGVAKGMDPGAATDLDAQHGFTRPEMFSEKLAGTWKDRVDYFLFLVSGKAEEWPEDIKDLPADSLFKVLQAALKKGNLRSNVKIVLAEAADGDTEGDVLVFPGATRFNIRGNTAALVDALQADRVEGCSSNVEDCHLFVCAHARRDARCGHCGPRLLEAARAGAGAAVLRKCSHVGGHAFAGNALVFRQGSGDFYGYVTPEALGDVLSGRARKGRLWRGALGLTREAAVRARRVQLAVEWAPVALLAFAAASGALFWLRRRVWRPPL